MKMTLKFYDREANSHNSFRIQRVLLSDFFFYKKGAESRQILAQKKQCAHFPALIRAFVMKPEENWIRRKWLRVKLLHTSIVLFNFVFCKAAFVYFTVTTHLFAAASVQHKADVLKQHLLELKMYQCTCSVTFRDVLIEISTFWFTSAICFA